MNHSFKRVEQKFILDSIRAEAIKDIIKTTTGEKRYSITSYYLESPNFYIYQMRKDRLPKRFKIRVREYDGKKSVWIELKEKRDGMGYKNRFKLDREHTQILLQGGDCFQRVVECNHKVDLEYLEMLYNTIREFIIEYSLEPKVAVSYERVAYDSGLKGAPRYTFDTQLKARIIDRNNIFHTDSPFIEYDNCKTIMEIKTSGTHPEVLKVIKKQFSLKRDRFSKFLFAIESHFFR